MRGHFSIEWMSQSSQPAEAGSGSGSGGRAGLGLGPAACGTHSESLPGFYCRQKSESSSKQREARSLDAFSLQQHVTEAAFSSGTEEEEEEEEETSGYESEGGRSLSPADCTSLSTSPSSLSTSSSSFTSLSTSSFTSLSTSSSSSSSSTSSSSSSSSSSPPSPPLGRRPRTAFTAEQISTLESSFKRNSYLGTQDKAELCRKLHLSDKQIRNWFQNRRMKLKRTVQDALAHASHFMHYPELQACRPGPYSRYQDGPAAGTPHGGPHGVPYGAPHGVPYGAPHGVPYGAPHGVPYGGPHGVPYGGPHGVPHGAPHGVPYGGPHGVPHGGPHGVPHGGPHGVPYGAPHGLQYGAALPLDSFYQYGLPAVVMPPATTPLVGSYAAYPQYY